MRKEKRSGLALEDGKWREIRQGKSQGEEFKERHHSCIHVFWFFMCRFNCACTCTRRKEMMRSLSPRDGNRPRSRWKKN